MIYRAVDNSSSLQHKAHKYLYKKKINGKWRYFYNVGKSNIGKIDGQVPSQYKGYTKFQDLMGYDERERTRRASLRRDAASRNFLRSQNEKTGEATRIEGHNYYEALWEFQKTPLGKLAEFNETVNNIRDRTSELLDKVSKKLKDHNNPYADLSKRDPGIEGESPVAMRRRLNKSR